VCDAEGNTNFCVNNFKCVSINGGLTAPVCLPTVEKEQPCNDTKEYDPCETSKNFFGGEVGFVCDRAQGATGKCIPMAPYAVINDGCENDDYCVTGLTCNNKECILPSGSNLACNANIGLCKLSQYCAFNFPNFTCKDRVGEGGDCDNNFFNPTPCQYNLYCDSDQKCVKQFSKAEGADCDDLLECTAGLECRDNKCEKPKLYILWGAPGVAWGGECDPETNTQGCQCNYGSHTYRYVLEGSFVYRPECAKLQDDYYKCLIDHDCRSTSDMDETCLRKNCYELAYNLAKTCLVPDPTAYPTRCGSATSLSLFLIFLVFVQFLF